VKRALKVVLLVACLAFLAFQIDWQGPPITEDWVELSPEGQNFSVVFPGEPETWTTFKELSPKDSLSSSNYRLEIEDTTYSIKVAKHVAPSTNDPLIIFEAEEGYNGFKQGLLQQTEGLLTSERDISSQDGTPGREYAISSQKNGDLVARIFYTGNMMFALSIICPTGHDISLEARRIFNSFTIIPDEEPS
jgi:hypothetical protein